MTTTAFKLKYADNVGFCADQGGRGFMMPTAMAIRDDGMIFVVSRSNTTAKNIVGIQKVTRDHGFFGQIGEYGSEAGQMIWPSALALDSEDNLYLADDPHRALDEEHSEAGKEMVLTLATTEMESSAAIEAVDQATMAIWSFLDGVYR